jgi:hypothetical protein
MPVLNSIGKEAVVNHHNQVHFHLLRCNPEFSVGEDSGSLLALKALLPYYAGQVKCIYIDPPYNTGDESWVYNDAVNSPEIQDWLGKVVGKEAEDLSVHRRRRKTRHRRAVGNAQPGVLPVHHADRTQFRCDPGKGDVKNQLDKRVEWS